MKADESALRRRGCSTRWLLGFAVFAAVLTSSAVLGSVLAASAQVTSGTAERGQGAYVSETGQAYWTWRDSQIRVVPTPVPAAVSLLAAAPTRLPGAPTSYMINAGVAGATAVRWQFTEATTAPVSTELELRFAVGLSATAVHITAYVETQAAHIGAAIVFTFYWDAGAFAPGTITIETIQATVLVCTSIGTCP